MSSSTALAKSDNNKLRRILGVDFFGGSAQEAIAIMRKGGLLVVPAAPSFRELVKSEEYRDAMLNADLAITDSAYMVLIWNLMTFDNLKRLSGLEYLRELVLEPDVRAPGNTMWVMASPKSARTNLDWLKEQGFDIPDEAVYMAPMYGKVMEDEELVRRLNQLRPQHVVLTVGGGVQERLGIYLKKRLEYRPAIHCIGAAIAFLSGDQVHIPVLADKFYLGWLYRCISEPKRYVPRYWEARKLLTLMVKYRSRLPPMNA